MYASNNPILFIDYMGMSTSKPKGANDNPDYDEEEQRRQQEQAELNARLARIQQITG